MNAWELRVVGGRAVLVSGEDRDGTGTGVDPRSLPIDAELATLLDEWASVAGNAGRTNRGVARLIARRGHQLAGKIAAATGAPIAFTDPVSGQRTVLGAAPGAREPTPWGTGLAVSGFAVLVVAFGMVVLSLALGQISGWLAFAANVIVTVGLAPTILLIRRMAVWRWVAYGATAGLAVGWLAWLAALL